MKRVVAATTMAEDRGDVLLVAGDLAGRLGAELLVVASVPSLPAGASGRLGHPAMTQVERWVRRTLPAGAAMPRVGVRGGLPSVELPRVADEVGADLLVIGREADGALADAMLRRSRRPCLVLPPRWRAVAPVLVALDGTERGFQVLDAARTFAERIDAPLHAVTVQAEPGAPTARTLAVQARVHGSPGVAPGAAALAVHDGPALHTRGGDVVSEVIAEARAVPAGILAVGWRWGGPSGYIPAGSVGRRLAHEAPCAVLTVPL